MRSFITEEQKKTIKQEEELDAVASFPDKNQKLAWKRKRKRIVELIGRIEPYEEQIRDLILKKQPIMDQIDEVRAAMVKDCIHPREELVHKGTHIECKFCQRKLKPVG
jgi:hypothetical protein